MTLVFQVICLKVHFLVSSCMTDPPRSASLGGCGGPAWRGLFAEQGTSVRISAHLTQIYACFGFTSRTKLHNHTADNYYYSQVIPKFQLKKTLHDAKFFDFLRETDCAYPVKSSRPL